MDYQAELLQEYLLRFKFKYLWFDCGAPDVDPGAAYSSGTTS